MYFWDVKKKIKLFIILALPLQILAVKLLSYFPEFVEKYYSQGIFKTISKVETYLFDYIPFSVGDILYIIAGIALVRWVYRLIKTKFREPRKWIVEFLTTSSILYFCFHLLWGLNYYRVPLHQKLEIEPTYNHNNLIDLTCFLIEESNALHAELSTQDSVAIQFDFASKQLNKIAIQSIDNLNINNLDLNHKFNTYKSSIFSLPLTYMGFSGYLNPLTNEAQVNAKVPIYKMPTLITHEMAHQIGYAKENEANFIAALSTMNHQNLHIKYAGYTFALQYCLSDIYRNNEEEAKQLIKEIHPGILKNYQEINDFWKAHQNPFEPFFKLFYDNYLKANNQPEGMKSYNYMVGLLVNYYLKEKTFEVHPN